MMQNKEIATAVLQKAALRKAQQATRKRRCRCACAVATSGACIVGAAFAMPQWAAQLAQSTPTNHTGMGTFFASTAALSYVIMGIGAFVLGVVVTLFCYKLKNNERQGD